MPEYITYRNIEYRLLPGSESTANELLSIWDACRFAWNEVKAAHELLYEHACGRKIEAPTFFHFGKAFSELRKQTPWLQDKSSHIVRHSLNYLAEAYKAFFLGDAGYPRWKSRYGTPSFTIPDNVKIKDDKLYVQKVGWLVLFLGLFRTQEGDLYRSIPVTDCSGHGLARYGSWVFLSK